jgi:hypothetical protein
VPDPDEQPLTDRVITLTLTRAGRNHIQFHSDGRYLGKMECVSGDAADFIEAFLRRLVREGQRA